MMIEIILLRKSWLYLEEKADEFSAFGEMHRPQVHIHFLAGHYRKMTLFAQVKEDELPNGAAYDDHILFIDLLDLFL